MHVTTRETDDSGVHILTSVIESDSATALVSEQAELSAKIISIQRTASGGIQVQVAVSVKEPAPAIALSPADQALAYFVDKGFTASDAAAQVARFGVDRILSQKANEEAVKQQDLDKELAAVLAGGDKPAPAVN